MDATHRRSHGYGFLLTSLLLLLLVNSSSSYLRWQPSRDDHPTRPSLSSDSILRSPRVAESRPLPNVAHPSYLMEEDRRSAREPQGSPNWREGVERGRGFSADEGAGARENGLNRGRHWQGKGEYEKSVSFGSPSRWAEVSL